MFVSRLINRGTLLSPKNLLADAFSRSQLLRCMQKRCLKDMGSTSTQPVPLLVSIEGNIGSGKSTLMDQLRGMRSDWIFIDEPVSLWSGLRNEEGCSLLQLFYSDRRRWSYTFQNCALLTRYQNIEAAVAAFLGKSTPGGGISHVAGSVVSSSGVRTGGGRRAGRQVFITERCLDTDHEVFTKMLHRDGSIDQLEFELYKRWFRHLQASATPLSAIVYVSTPPKECAQRILRRGREGEGAIPLHYLEALDEQQRAWLDRKLVPCLHTSADVASGSAVQEFIDNLSGEQL